MGLQKSVDFKNLIVAEMTRAVDLYLKIKEYSTKFTPEYEEVFYNANRDLNYQTMLIIAAIRNDDNDEEIKKKRGGFRPNSGRKKTSVKYYGFKAPQEVCDILENVRHCSCRAY
jgi:hypothetical protein